MTAIRPARTETFEHTVSGLLAKRADLYNKAERIRDRLAEIRNDIGALDRMLLRLGAALLIDHRLNGPEGDFHVGNFAHRVVGGDRTGFRRNLDEVSLSRQQPGAECFKFGFHGQCLAVG